MSLYFNQLILEKLDDDVIFKVRKCGRCRENIIEEFRLQIKGEPSYETLLFGIMQDKNIKLEFDDIKIVCPSCKDHMKDITYIQFEKEDIELINKTSLSKVWLTMDYV